MESGYLITFYGFNHFSEAEVFKKEVKVGFDGRIEELSQITLVECEGGILY